ncbi:hypothetical protein WJX81_001114 [Elliptochloris bilobata]|uniref:Uncharacterized protein n=1 Tax=Elliptochloris bilobata TaxID=381761 RepID=A0AAW1QIS1_9CHLO
MKLGTLGAPRPLLASLPSQLAPHPSSRLSALLTLRTRSSLSPPSTLLPQAAADVSSAAAYAEPAYAEPPQEIGEVDWRVEYVNSVAVIGRLGLDFEIKKTQTGLPVTSNRLAIRGPKERTDWVDIEVWGELAERAAAELKKGTQVQVLGRMRVDEWQDRTTQQKRRGTKIVAATLDVVRPFSYGGTRPSAIPMQPDAPAEEQAAWGKPAGGAQPDALAVDQPGGEVWPVDPVSQAAAPAASPEDKWRRFFADPTRYWDNRVGKRNERAPDFKHKDTGEALWMNDRYAPPWVAAELERQFPSAASAEPSDTNPY